MGWERQRTVGQMLSRRAFILASCSCVACQPGLVQAQPPNVGDFFTASGVSLALLNGAGGLIGNIALSAVLGQATISDVKDWIAAAVAEIERFVAAEFEQAALESMQGKLTLIQNNLNHHASLNASNQNADRQLLLDADDASSELITVSLYHPQGILISLAAVAYRLIILWSLYKLQNDPGHFNSAGEKNFIAQTLESVTKARDAIATSLAASAHVSSSCVFMLKLVTPYCQVLVDGKDEATYQNEFNWQRPKTNAELARVSAPYNEHHDAFLSVVNDSLGRAVKVYADMLHHVRGGDFDPDLPGVTIPINSIPIDPTHRSMRRVVMPGAQVWLPVATPGSSSPQH